MKPRGTYLVLGRAEGKIPAGVVSKVNCSIFIAYPA